MKAEHLKDLASIVVLIFTFGLIIIFGCDHLFDFVWPKVSTNITSTAYAHSAKSPLDEQRVLIIGDSQVKGPFGIHLGYQLSRKGVTHYYREGREGWGVRKWWNKRHSITRLIKRQKPTLLLIELGGNDWHRDDTLSYKNRIKALLKFANQLMKQYSPSDNPQVLWIGPAEAVNQPRDVNRKRERIIDIIKDVVGNSHFVESRDITGHYGRTEDGLHFTYGGGQAWAEKAANRIEEKLKELLE